MFSYAALPMPLKTLLVTALFLALSTGVSLCFLVGRKQGMRRAILLIISTLLLAAPMLLYASVIRAERAGPDIPAVSLWFADLPLLLPVLLAAVILAFFAQVIIAEQRRRRTDVSLSSIKESLDHLQTGLCFSRPSGLILLTNHRMNELSHALFDRPLQNANLFWDALRSGEPCAGVVRLSGGDHPQFRLEDGTIRSFKRELLRGAVQITAADTTRQHQLIAELQVQNRELEAMNARVRRYGEKVDEYVTARERLETRVNLHGFLGQSLLMTRHYLQSRAGDRNRILDVWQRNIDVLRLEAEPQQESDSFASLQRSAEAIGMHVHLRGSLPGDPRLRKLAAAIGAETLTNAFRHAGAGQLFIDAAETENAFIIRYTNDGAAPAHAVAEGGGLSAARRKVEAAGGSMRIESRPQFTLILSFEKR